MLDWKILMSCCRMSQSTSAYERLNIKDACATCVRWCAHVQHVHYVGKHIYMQEHIIGEYITSCLCAPVCVCDCVLPLCACMHLCSYVSQSVYTSARYASPSSQRQRHTYACSRCSTRGARTRRSYCNATYSSVPECPGSPDAEQMYAVIAFVISWTILDGALWDKNTYRATDRAMKN